MHRGFDTVGNRGGGGGAGGICGAARKHAPTICAFVALVLVVVTLLTRHDTERGGAGTGGGFGSALSSGIRFNADYQQGKGQCGIGLLLTIDVIESGFLSLLHFVCSAPSFLRNVSHLLPIFHDITQLPLYRIIVFMAWISRTLAQPSRACLGKNVPPCAI